MHIGRPRTIGMWSYDIGLVAFESALNIKVGIILRLLISLSLSVLEPTLILAQA